MAYSSQEHARFPPRRLPIAKRYLDLLGKSIWGEAGSVHGIVVTRLRAHKIHPPPPRSKFRLISEEQRAEALERLTPDERAFATIVDILYDFEHKSKDMLRELLELTPHQWKKFYDDWAYERAYGPR